MSRVHQYSAEKSVDAALSAAEALAGFPAPYRAKVLMLNDFPVGGTSVRDDTEYAEKPG